MKVTIPNPNMPAEVDQIEYFMGLLEDCKVQGGWNVGMLDKQLNNREEVWRATERLRSLLEEIFPPVVVDVGEGKEEAA